MLDFDHMNMNESAPDRAELLRQQLKTVEQRLVQVATDRAVGGRGDAVGSQEELLLKQKADIEAELEKLG